jgi:general secretion pathway protein H
MTRHGGVGGFTLVEMLVVLSLAALVLAVSVPYSTRSGEARKLDAAAQFVAAKLRETRAAALGANRERTLTFDVAEGRLIQSDPERSFSVPRGIAIVVETADEELVAGSAAFRFFPDGGTTGGRIVLSLGGREAEIAISWLTGAVVVAGEAAP